MGTATWAMKNTPIPSHYNTSWLVNTSIMAQLSFIHDIPIVLMVWTPSDLHNGWLLFNPSTEVFFMAHWPPGCAWYCLRARVIFSKRSLCLWCAEFSKSCWDKPYRVNFMGIMYIYIYSSIVYIHTCPLYIPYAPCMEYLPTFALKITQM